MQLCWACGLRLVLKCQLLLAQRFNCLTNFAHVAGRPYAAVPALLHIFPGHLGPLAVSESDQVTCKAGPQASCRCCCACTSAMLLLPYKAKPQQWQMGPLAQCSAVDSEQGSQLGLRLWSKCPKGDERAAARQASPLPPPYSDRFGADFRSTAFQPAAMAHSPRHSPRHRSRHALDICALHADESSL